MWDSCTIDDYSFFFVLASRHVTESKVQFTLGIPIVRQELE